MIDSITLKGYRGHTSTTIPCGRLTVLVGENATGKTSVLRALAWASKGFEQTLPTSWLRSGDHELSLSIAGREHDKDFRVEVTYRLLDGVNRDSPLSLARVEGSAVSEGDSPARRPQAIFLSLSEGALAAPSSSKQAIPALSPSGRGLASLLAYLKLVDTARFERIVERLRAVVPIVRGIGFTRVAVEETGQRTIRVEDRLIEIPETITTIRDALLFDFVDAEKVPADLVSEGTLISLGMLAALEQIDRARVDVILIDDIDRALHPRAQRELMTTLRAILDASPGLQILATSHSPYMIDALQPEEVVILGRNAKGVVVAKRLDTFPDTRLREMLSTGELWMSEGDEWVTR